MLPFEMNRLKYLWSVSVFPTPSMILMQSSFVMGNVSSTATHGAISWSWTLCIPVGPNISTANFLELSRREPVRILAV